MITNCPFLRLVCEPEWPSPGKRSAKIAVGGVIIGLAVDKWERDSLPNCDAAYSRFGTPVLESVVRSGISGSFSKVRIVLLPS